jgi:thioredoxin-dependent peroxiredoxin
MAERIPVLKIGDKAPDFALPAGDGSTVRLKDFKGTKIVLYFYPKDNTSGCTAEACAFQEQLPAVRTKGAVVIGVSADSVKSHASFASKFGLRFLLLSDESKDVLKAYGVWKKKSMYGRSYFGVERTTVLVDAKGVVTRIFPKVNVNGHVAEVLAAL